ncbi:release factor glutamine methyltransferase [Roseateles sp. YR242]|uniref:HemK2/MTQ2 family protein methyltransferase n=1 Tax=Roseateles sp. YR242 TaxID=1855305 RepID=UPI0008C17465|nr:HemK2/MTQ2 family protein methyltransferase [Roseateles sp. YR242]SEL87690.1 release factor glutamine methyltransferase [Roseateles sp. YR242]
MYHDDVFRPSEYTAALLRQLWSRPACTGRVLEIGTGSGVVLATLARAGAREVMGVDIESDAVQRTRELLLAEGFPAASVHCGDLWEPVDTQTFDLVVFNPPQLPVLDDAPQLHRLRSWSNGGPQGREVLDRFLAGLGQHLAPDGLALITHSSFVGWALTLQQLAACGLRAEVVETVTAIVPPSKLQVLPAGWLERHDGQSLHRIGPYVFCDFHVVEIRHAAPV